MTDPADIAHERYEAFLAEGTDLLDPDPYWDFVPGPTTAPTAGEED